MALVDRKFPKPFSYGTSGGPQALTRILPGPTGREARSSKLTRPRRRYDASAAIRSYEDLAAIRDFFYAMNGAQQAFLLDDPLQNSTAADGKSDPTALDYVLTRVADTQYQLARRYPTGTEEVVIPITYPVEDTVLIALDGTPTTSFTVDYTGGTGIVTIASLAGDTETIVTGGCKEWVPVRFDGDEWLSVTADDFSNASIPSIPLIEVLDEPTVPGFWAPGGVVVRDIDDTLTPTPSFGVTWILSATDPQDVTMPTPSGYADGKYFTIANNGSENLTVKDNLGTTLTTLANGEACDVYYYDGYGWFIIGD